VRAEIQEQYKHLEAIVVDIAGSVEKVLQKEDITLEKLKEEEDPSDWEMITNAWKDYKSGKRTLKDILWGATKELGKRGLKKLVSKFTLGLIGSD
jgi:hypothetical protein